MKLKKEILFVLFLVSSIFVSTDLLEQVRSQEPPEPIYRERYDRFSTEKCWDFNCSRIISLNSINYFNGSDWNEINQTLVPKTLSISGRDYNFGISTGVYEAYFRDVSSDVKTRPVAVVKDEYYLTLAPQDFITFEPHSSGKNGRVANRQSSTAITNYNKLTYPEHYKQIGSSNYFANLTFLYLPDYLKEELVIYDKSYLNERFDSQVDVEDINVTNLVFPTKIRVYYVNDTDSQTLGLVYGRDRKKFKDYGLSTNDEINTNEEIYFTDQQNNTVYFIPQLYAYDSNNSQILLNKTLSMTAFGNLRIDILTPFWWLNNTARVYPVYIDPSISQAVHDDVYTESSGPTIPGSPIGQQGYLKFPLNISDLAEGSDITYGELIMEATGITGSGAVLSIYNCSTEWTESSSYGTVTGLPCSNSELNNTNVASTGIYRWNVTDALIGNFNPSSIANITFRLNSTGLDQTSILTDATTLVIGDDDSAGANTATFAAKENGGAVVNPKLNITYTSDSTPPVVGHDSELSYNYSWKNSDFTINYTFTDDNALSSCKVSYERSTDGGVTWTEVIGIATGCTGTSNTSRQGVSVGKHSALDFLQCFNRTINYQNSTCRAWATGTDSNGNQGNSTKRYFRIDWNPPQLTYSDPTPIDNTYVKSIDSILINSSLDFELNPGSIYVNWNGTRIPSEDGLLLWLPFNEGGGNFTEGHSSTPQNGSLVGFGCEQLNCNAKSGWNSSGKIGSAIVFDGFNDYIDVADESRFDFVNNFTLVASLKATSVGRSGSYGSLFAKLGFTSGGYDWMVHSGGSMRMTIRGSSNIDTGNKGSGLLDGNWHQVVAVNSNSDIKLYIDGELVSTTTGTWTPTTNDISLRLGWRQNGNMYFNGTLDEFMVWNRSLNPQEIRDIYNLKEYSTNISLINEGIHTYNITHIDSARNKNTTTTRTYTLDSTNPLIDYVIPTYSNNAEVNVDYFGVNVTITEINFANYTFVLSNSTAEINRTYITSETATRINFTSLPDGVYTYNVTITDLAGNKNFTTTRNITIDTTLPIIEFITPTPLNNSNQSSNNFIVNVSITELNMGTAIVSINTTNFTMTCLNNNCNYTTSSLSDGSYRFRVTVNDTFGNYNNTNIRIVTIDTINPFIAYIGDTPINNTNQTSSGNININITSNDITTGVANLTFTLVNISNGSMTELNRTFIYNSLPNSTLIFTSLKNGTYIFNVTATDYVGNKNTTISRTININTTVTPSVTGGGGGGSSGGNRNIGNVSIKVNVPSVWFLNSEIKLNVTFLNSKGSSIIQSQQKYNTIPIRLNHESIIKKGGSYEITYIIPNTKVIVGKYNLTISSERAPINTFEFEIRETTIKDSRIYQDLEKRFSENRFLFIVLILSIFLLLLLLLFLVFFLYRKIKKIKNP